MVTKGLGVRLLLAAVGLWVACAQWAGAQSGESIDWKVAEAPAVVVARAVAAPAAGPRALTNGEFEVVERIKGMEGVRTFRLQWLLPDDRPYRAWATQRTPLLLFVRPLGHGLYVPQYGSFGDWDRSAFALDGAGPIRHAYSAALDPLTTPAALLAAARAAAARAFPPQPYYLLLPVDHEIEDLPIGGGATIKLPRGAWDGYAAEALFTSPRPWVRGLAIRQARLSSPTDRAHLTRLLTDPHPEEGDGPLGWRRTYPIRQRAWRALREWGVDVPAPVVESPGFYARLGRVVVGPAVGCLALYAVYRYRTRRRRLVRPRVPVRRRLVRVAVVSSYLGAVVVAAAWVPAARRDYGVSLNDGGGRVFGIRAEKGGLRARVISGWPDRVSRVDAGSGPGAPGNDAAPNVSATPRDALHLGRLVVQWDDVHARDDGQSSFVRRAPRTVVVVPWLYLFPPFAAVVLGHLVYLLTVGRRRRRRARMVLRGLCPDCGYDLRGSTDRCPECGRAVHPANEWIKLLQADSSSPSAMDRA